MAIPALGRNAWVTIVCGCLLLMFAFGFRASYGLFVEPISAANGWGRDIIGLALAIQNLTWGVVAVLAGGLADRFGNTVVIIAGALLYSLGLWMTSDVASIAALQTGAGLLVGAGIAGTSFGIVLPLMAKAVDESQQQWVLGVGTAAGSLGQFLLVPMAQQFIDLWGWSGAMNVMAVMALGMILLAMPLAKMVGATAIHGVSVDGTDSFRSTVSLARRHASYWLLTIGFFVCGFHLAFITVHMPGFLSDNGFAPSVAAWAIALMGLFNMVGSLASGVLSGRLSKRRVLIAIYGGRAVAIVGFMLVPLSVTSIVLFSVIMGLLWLATVPPTSGLVATMFGTRYMATLYGVVFLGHQVGSFTGVWLGGWIYETTGSYNGIWWAGVVLSGAAMALHWPIREERAVAQPA